MKILKAKNNINTVEVALADITVDNKPVTEVAEHWAVFQRQSTMALDIAKNGLTFPIIVKKDGDKLLFTASGCRIQFAILNGYTHIDALILEDDAEILATMEAQRVNDNEILEGVPA